MRFRKIRGHKRIQRAVERWRTKNINLGLNEYLLNEYNYDNTEIWVRPFCDLSIINSAIPSPSGKTKLKILSGLLDIYDCWEKQLEALGQSYYIKIWLYHPRFSKSQVVCAIGDRISWYENLFYMPKSIETIDLINYGSLNERIKNYKWNYCLDEDRIDSQWVGEIDSYVSKKDYMEDKLWFDKQLTKPHRITTQQSLEVYSFKKGHLWIGSN